MDTPVLEFREYHKINSVFKRDQKTNRFLVGEFATPEIEYLQYNEWEWTEKVDGTNIRVHWDGTGDIRFGGRTDNASIPAFLVARLQNLFLSAEGHSRLRQAFDCEMQNVTLYGEGYGARIQKGGGLYKPDGVDFVLFDVRIGRWWLKRSDVDAIAAELGIDSVPTIGSGTIWQAIEAVKAGIKSPRWPDATTEGLVVRPMTELFDRAGNRVITKIKARDFFGK